MKRMERFVSRLQRMDWMTIPVTSPAFLALPAFVVAVWFLQDQVVSVETYNRQLFWVHYVAFIAVIVGLATSFAHMFRFESAAEKKRCLMHHTIISSFPAFFLILDWLNIVVFGDYYFENGIYPFVHPDFPFRTLGPLFDHHMPGVAIGGTVIVMVALIVLSVYQFADEWHFAGIES